MRAIKKCRAEPAIYTKIFKFMIRAWHNPFRLAIIKLNALDAPNTQYRLTQQSGHTIRCLNLPTPIESTLLFLYHHLKKNYLMLGDYAP